MDGPPDRLGHMRACPARGPPLLARASTTWPGPIPGCGGSQTPSLPSPSSISQGHRAARGHRHRVTQRPRRPRAKLVARDGWLGLNIGPRRQLLTVQRNCARTPATATGSRAQSATFEAAAQKSQFQVDEREDVTPRVFASKVASKCLRHSAHPPPIGRWLSNIWWRASACVAGGEKRLSKL